VILLDPKNSPLLNHHFNEIVKIISEKIPIEKEICKIIAKYVRDKIFPAEHASKLKAFMITKQWDKTIPKIKIKDTRVLAIPIDSFISEKLGVCRHHALVTAYIMDGLTKLCSNKTNRPYLSGNVQIIRDNLKSGGAHAWTAYTTKTNMIHIDTLWNIISDFSNAKNREKLERIYGAEVILRQIKKISRNLRDSNILAIFDTRKYASVKELV
jgi:hypothetical protein